MEYLEGSGTGAGWRWFPAPRQNEGEGAMAATMVETEDFPGMHELEPVRTPSPLWLRPVEWLAGALFVALVRSS